jgi:hypothetical protein
VGWDFSEKIYSRGFFSWTLMKEGGWAEGGDGDRKEGDSKSNHFFSPSLSSWPPFQLVMVQKKENEEKREGDALGRLNLVAFSSRLFKQHFCP